MESEERVLKILYDREQLGNQGTSIDHIFQKLSQYDKSEIEIILKHFEKQGWIIFPNKDEYPRLIRLTYNGKACYMEMTIRTKSIVLHKLKHKLKVPGSIILFVIAIAGFVVQLNQSKKEGEQKRIISLEDSSSIQVLQIEPEKKIASEVIVMDGYHAVKIGNQVWMSENFNEDVFQDGERIPLASNASTWARYSAKRLPCCCYYNFIPSKENGKLYNWWVVSNSREIAPKGWHVPSNEEWIELINYCQKFGDSLFLPAKPIGWISKLGNFSRPNYSADWWSSNEKNSDSAWNVWFRKTDGLKMNYFDKGAGFSIRLLRNK